MASDPGAPDNQEGEAQRPDWLPDNFDSPEALAASYKEAQRKITEETSARKALEQNYADLSARLDEIQAPQPQYDINDIAGQYGVEPEQLQLMAQIAAQAAQMQVQQYQQQNQPMQQSQEELVVDHAQQRLASKYQDFGDYAEQVADQIRAKPWLYPDEARTSPAKAVDALETVYNLVKYQDISAQAQTEQVSPADLMTRMKLQAQSAQGADGRPAPSDPNANRWEEITNARVRSYEEIMRGPNR